MASDAAVAPMAMTTAAEIDITNGDRASADAPADVPGIQPHGALLVLGRDDHRVSQASANVAEIVRKALSDVLGKTLADVLGPAATHVEQALAGQALGRAPLYLCTIKLPTAVDPRPFNVIAHDVEGNVVLELEPAASGEQLTFRYLYTLVQRFVERLTRAATIGELSTMVASEIRRITGFDRVFVYRFDREWNGQVIAEDRDDALPSYLDLWLPAADLPPEARERYRRNRLRIVADARQPSAPLVPSTRPDTDKPLDLSFASLRSVTSSHREYLASMDVAASMSVSVLVDGELWGLVSCHHHTPRSVPFDVQTACDLIGQLFALEIAAKEHRESYEERIQLKGHEAALLAYMAQEEHFVRGLIGHPDELLALTGAEGAAVVYDGKCTLVGLTPPEDAVRALVDWLADRCQEVFSTNTLPSLVPDGERYREQASGLLAVPISKLYRSYVLWFRPERAHEVRWRGSTANGATPIPGSSFAVYQEIVHGRSRRWGQAHLEAALGLRHAIIGIVLRRAEELAALSAELARANQELEAFSYSVSHDLRAPFRHIVGYSELLRDRLPADFDPRARRYIDTIVESAQFAGTLVDNLLAFSQIGRSRMHFATVPLTDLVGTVTKNFDVDTRERQIRWDIGELPVVVGDAVLLRLAFQNLLGNALKYTRERNPAIITVTATVNDAEAVVAVRDNGVGFDMRYAHKLFGVFQRLHRVEEYEGTGIGLANVRRIAERHGGRVWAEGAVDAGATFYLALPLRRSTAGAETHAETDSAS